MGFKGKKPLLQGRMYGIISTEDSVWEVRAVAFSVIMSMPERGLHECGRSVCEQRVNDVLCGVR